MIFIENKTFDYCLLGASASLFIAGILMPMFTFEKFFFFNDTFSMIGGLLHLLNKGEFLLFFIIFGFSIMDPLYKFFLCFKILRTHSLVSKCKLVKFLALVSKWSMADVFLIAVLAATIKMKMISQIHIHSGVYVFCSAVIAGMVLVHRQMVKFEFVPRKASV